VSPLRLRRYPRWPLYEGLLLLLLALLLLWWGLR